MEEEKVLGMKFMATVTGLKGTCHASKRGLIFV